MQIQSNTYVLVLVHVMEEFMEQMYEYVNITTNGSDSQSGILNEKMSIIRYDYKHKQCMRHFKKVISTLAISKALTCKYST